jgi:hypothetical protein
MWIDRDPRRSPHFCRVPCKPHIRRELILTTVPHSGWGRAPRERHHSLQTSDCSAFAVQLGLLGLSGSGLEDCAFRQHTVGDEPPQRDEQFSGQSHHHSAMRRSNSNHYVHMSSTSGRILWLRPSGPPARCRHAAAAARAELNGQENIWQFMRRTGSQIRCSNPSTVSSITSATLETPSSISLGKSCPSPAATGQPWVTQCEY